MSLSFFAGALQKVQRTQQEMQGNCISFHDLSAMRKPVYDFARRLSRSKHRADDLAQETLIKAYVARDAFDGGNLKNWLFTICQNLYFSQLRHERHEMLGIEIAPEFEPVSEFRADVQIDAGLVLERMSALTPEHRDVLITYAELDDYAATAAALGLKPGTVRSRIFRAREALDEQRPRRYARAAGSPLIWGRSVSAAARRLGVGRRAVQRARAAGMVGGAR